MVGVRRDVGGWVDVRGLIVAWSHACTYIDNGAFTRDSTHRDERAAGVAVVLGGGLLPLHHPRQVVHQHGSLLLSCRFGACGRWVVGVVILGLYIQSEGGPAHTCATKNGCGSGVHVATTYPPRR